MPASSSVAEGRIAISYNLETHIRAPKFYSSVVSSTQTLEYPCTSGQATEVRCVTNPASASCLACARRNTPHNSGCVDGAACREATLPHKSSTQNIGTAMKSRSPLHEHPLGDNCSVSKSQPPYGENKDSPETLSSGSGRSPTVNTMLSLRVAGTEYRLASQSLYEQPPNGTCNAIPEHDRNSIAAPEMPPGANAKGATPTSTYQNVKSQSRSESVAEVSHEVFTHYSTST